MIRVGHMVIISFHHKHIQQQSYHVILQSRNHLFQSRCFIWRHIFVETPSTTHPPWPPRPWWSLTEDVGIDQAVSGRVGGVRIKGGWCVSVPQVSSIFFWGEELFGTGKSRVPGNQRLKRWMWVRLYHQFRWSWKDFFSFYMLSFSE